jgi:hypothetical protein
VDADDGIRDGVTKESLSKLKPAFSKTGSTHAGELGSRSMCKYEEYSCESHSAR